MYLLRCISSVPFQFLLKRVLQNAWHTFRGEGQGQGIAGGSGGGGCLSGEGVVSGAQLPRFSALRIAKVSFIKIALKGDRFNMPK